MKCFKHLCAKLFFCLFVGVIGFATNVKADELTEEAMRAVEARAQDVDRLSRVIQTEGGTFDDKVCVGLTALHRVDSPQFPNTVKENIYAPSQYAKPAKGEVLPENLLAAEYAMELWENGISYSVLPDGYLYFAGNGKRNRFRNAEGDHYDAPDIAQFIPYVTTQGSDGALISCAIF